MKNLKRTLSLLIVFALIFICSGCMRMDIGVEIKEDGTASMSAKMSIEESVYNMLSGFGTTPSEDSDMDLSEFVKETIDGTNYYSYTETKEFNSYDDLIVELKSLEATDENNLFEHVNVVAEKGEKYTFALKTAVVEAPSDGGMEIPDNWLVVTMTVKMPGEVTDTNGEILEDGSVRFDMTDFTSNTEYFVHSKTSSPLSLFPLIMILSTIVFALIILIKIMESRQEKKEEREKFKEEKKDENYSDSFSEKEDKEEEKIEETNEEEEKFFEEDMAPTIEYKTFSASEKEKDSE